MTALDRARGWFIAPPDATSDEPSWCALNQTAQEGGVQFSRRLAATPLQPPVTRSPHPEWQPPVAKEPGEDGVARDGEVAPSAEEQEAGAHRDGSRASSAEGPELASAGTTAHHAWRPPAPGLSTKEFVPPAAEHGRSTALDVPVSAQIAGSRELTSAAVLGRTGEVEPVAAALALTLRRKTRAATATVGLVGAALPDLAEGGRAARRLGERLHAQGFDVRIRGRLAWVRLDPGEGQIAAAARRLILVGAPAVLAVSAPRNADTDEALLECDLLVIVTPDPGGPLASLAASGLTGAPLVTVRPLARGPARALARAGIRSSRSVRHLLATEQEQR